MDVYGIMTDFFDYPGLPEAMMLVGIFAAESVTAADYMMYERHQDVFSSFQDYDCQTHRFIQRLSYGPSHPMRIDLTDSHDQELWDCFDETMNEFARKSTERRECAS